MAEEVDRGTRIDLKIGCRYRWTVGQVDVVVWDFSAASGVLVMLPEARRVGLAYWVGRDELEPLDD